MTEDEIRQQLIEYQKSVFGPGLVERTLGMTCIKSQGSLQQDNLESALRSYRHSTLQSELQKSEHILRQMTINKDDKK